MDKTTLLEQLQQYPDYDAAVLRIEDADYGCEEPRDPPNLWLLLLTNQGDLLPREVPEPLVEQLHLTIGSLCRLADLKLSFSS